MDATQALVWMICESFEEVCFVKPVTSRPANAERYLVARRLRKQAELQLSKMKMMECLLSIVEGGPNVKLSLPFSPNVDFHAFLERANVWINALQARASEQILLDLFTHTRFS